MNDIEIVVFNDKSWVRLSEYQKVKEENEQLRNELLQQQQLVRDLKCCGNCDRKENRGLCGYEDRCYSYIYTKQYLRPFFCDPVDLKEIEGYKDFWKPISCTYHIRGEKK